MFVWYHPNRQPVGEILQKNNINNIIYFYIKY